MKLKLFILSIVIVVIIVSCTLFARDQENYYENAKDISNNPDSGRRANSERKTSLWDFN